ncbi:MAG: Uma2 family endonuclease [Clostridiales bacterium]|jgi:Uma2 family endonuclease|nr:Uma2 family endonuclease [Clostridiales bacterium]
MSAARKLEEFLEVKRHYTYEDYAKWETDKRFELIDGVPYAMAAPNTLHQRVSRRLLRKLFARLPEGDVCEVFHPPYDVRLNFDTRDDTVVQPDLIVVCDPKKIDGKSIKGGPDWVIEILSPSNSHREIMLKYKKYCEAGVKEIWFIDPENKTIDVHKMDEELGDYVVNLYKFPDIVPVGILPGFAIDTRDIFEV